MQELETSQTTTPLPQPFLDYINEKIKKNGEGGRPHFLQQLAKTHDPIDETLLILERAWLKQESYGKIAKDYQTTYHTIWRMVQDLEPYKQPITDYLTYVPRKKAFFNERLETSDYESVRNYIRRAKRDQHKQWKTVLRNAERCWKFLKYTDPTKWTSYEVADFLSTQLPSMQYHCLVAIRQIAPQIGEGGSDELSVARYSELQKIRKKDIFGNEINLILDCLRTKNMNYHENIFQLHITIGAREGKRDPNAGMSGLRWNHFKENFTKVDLFESKVKGGIWWRNCPINIFFPNLPEKLKQLWIDEGKPIDKRILNSTTYNTKKYDITYKDYRPYDILRKIYKEIREALAEYYQGKLEPSIYQELTTLLPHDADKIHVNLLWEAEVPLEVVAGQYFGKGEGLGLMGRGWLTIDVIKKHYLSLTQRTERFQKLLQQVNEYSNRFKGD